MKRYLGTDEDREHVKKLLVSEGSGWRKERLIALNMGFSPDHSLGQIAEIIGRSIPTIQRWFDLYRQEGLSGVLQRHFKGRTHTYSNEEIMDYLARGLKANRWNTVVQAQQELEKHFDRKLQYHNVWYWIKKCAGVLRVPRPVHEKRDPKKAEAFKRSFYGHLQRLPLSRSRPVKVWFADESRYGLLPQLRRVWTRRGHRPHKRWQTRYEWSYCYGALDIVEGKTVFLQTPTVNLDWTEAFLRQIKLQYPDHEHVVVWDGAGFHPKDSSHEKIPEGIHILMLPPYSPELNPIEKLWDLIQDHTSNKLWPSIKRLDQVVGLLLKDWWEDPRKVISLVGNNWHRASANASVN